MTSLAAIDHGYVRFIFRGARHVPVLVSGTAPELDDLRTSVAGEPLSPISELRDEGRALVAACKGHPDPVAAFIGQELEAVLTQLDVADGVAVPYGELCTRLLDVPVAPVPEAELDLLYQRTLDLAGRVLGRATPESVRSWETAGLTGREKTEAMGALVEELRERTRARLPLFPECGVELAETDDPVVSVGAFYFGRRHNRIDVNPALPRPRPVLLFEAAHNVFPGDAFHLAAIEEHYLRKRGLLVGGIKVKNTPDNVICEGIEDLALTFLFDGDVPEDVALALSLEELRRGWAVNAALALRQDGRPEQDVRSVLADRALMTPARVAQTIALIRHPLWGTYVYTYWGGRKLVGSAWTHARSQDTEREFFTLLYSELLTPTLFRQQATTPSAA